MKTGTRNLPQKRENAMRQQRHRKAEAAVDLRRWTYAEAMNAVPYLRSIVRSLREHWLEWRRARLQVRRLDARPGRPDWQALILRAEVAQDAELARDHFREARRELEALDVYCVEPAGGVAL